MKITNRKLLELNGTFSKILGTPIDFKLAYRINKIAGKIMSEYKVIEEARQKLFQKYGVKNDKGGLTIPEKNTEAFKKEFDALLDIETDLAIQKIPADCLREIKISAYELSQIADFIEEESK